MKNLALRQKISSIVALSLVCVAITAIWLTLEQTNGALAEKKEKLKNIVEVGHSIINYNYIRFVNGEISEEEAKKTPKRLLGRLDTTRESIFGLTTSQNLIQKC